MKQSLKPRVLLPLLALLAALSLALGACNFSVPEDGPGYPPDLEELYGELGGHGDEHGADDHGTDDHATDEHATDDHAEPEDHDDHGTEEDDHGETAAH